MGLAFGALLFAALVAYQGAGQVAEVVVLVGWWLVPITLWHMGALAVGSLSAQVLLPRARRLPLPRLAWAWWVGYAVNALLPVARVGGELVRARLFVHAGVPGPAAGAAAIVGLTAAVLSLVVFGTAAALLLLARAGAGRTGWTILAGLAVLAVLLLGFYLAQRAGMFARAVRLVEDRFGGRDWTRLAGGAAALDRAIAARYRRWPVFVACWLWRLAGWLLAVFEVWLVFWAIGAPISLVDAFILEGLSQAIKAAGFAIPGALGVQEGGHLLVGSLLGLPGHHTVGLSLVKRARDILMGLPMLASWQLVEGADFARTLGRRGDRGPRD